MFDEKDLKEDEKNNCMANLTDETSNSLEKKKRRKNPESENPALLKNTFSSELTNAQFSNYQHNSEYPSQFHYGARYLVNDSTEKKEEKKDKDIHLATDIENNSIYSNHLKPYYDPSMYPTVSEKDYMYYDNPVEHFNQGFVPKKTLGNHYPGSLYGGDQFSQYNNLNKSFGPDIPYKIGNNQLKPSKFNVSPYSAVSGYSQYPSNSKLNYRQHAPVSLYNEINNNQGAYGSTYTKSDFKIDTNLLPYLPPKTLAQLRVVLLIGFVLGESVSVENSMRHDGLSPETSEKSSSTNDFYLSFTCPIHSSCISRQFKNFFVKYLGHTQNSVLQFNNSLIAVELHCLASELVDPVIGYISNLLTVDIVGQQSLIVTHCDVSQCEKVIREALKPNHPSACISLWNTVKLTSNTDSNSKLELGEGLGVENRSTLVLPFTLSNDDSFTTQTNIPFNDLKNDHSSFKLRSLKNNFSCNVNSSILADSTNTKNILLNSESDSQLSSIPYDPLKLKNNLKSHPNTFLQNVEPTKNSHELERLPHKQNISLKESSNQSQNSKVKNLDSSSSMIEHLLNVPSVKEQQLRDTSAELRQLLAIPTAKHYITTKAFQNQGGSRVQQICPHGTRRDCLEASIQLYNEQRQKQTFARIPSPCVCQLVHFRRILLPHTDASLGDCSYLDTCRHMSSCRFVHYEIDLEVTTENQKSELLERMELNDCSGQTGHNIGTVFSGHLEALPAQWISCDVRKFDWSIFRGKVKILMADPPWDIHMDLPYGTMTDTEMKSLRLDQVQDEGCLFLWVTGRAMELGRECLKLWGYRQIEEIVWIKTNQLHRIIRTGRTGHWLNHSKEHCLVGIKGYPKINRNIDADIIVAEVRETSRKPDEIYRIIERLCPGPYKLELFGRQHNVRENWITLGNQLSGVHLHDNELISRYNSFISSHGLPGYNANIESEVTEKE